MAALTRAIVRLASDLGMALIAEGVEEAGQAQQLAAMGATLAQGWLFAKAGPPAEIGPLLAASQPIIDAQLLAQINGVVPAQLQVPTPTRTDIAVCASATIRGSKHVFTHSAYQATPVGD